MEPAPKGGLDSKETPLEKAFSFASRYQVQVASWLGLRVGVHSGSTGTPSGLNLWCCQSLWVPCAPALLCLLFPWSSTNVNTVKTADSILWKEFQPSRSLEIKGQEDAKWSTCHTCLNTRGRRSLRNIKRKWERQSSNHNKYLPLLLKITFSIHITFCFSLATVTYT